MRLVQKMGSVAVESIAPISTAHEINDVAAHPGPRVKLNVVLPAFNESADLPILLARLNSVLSKTDYDYQITIVDDGSTDDTAEIATRAGASAPVVLIKHGVNQGLGAAVRTGLTSALSRDGIALIMDADNSHDPATIPSMVSKINEGYDVVIASRFQPGGKMIGVKFSRLLLSYGASATLRLFFRYRNVRDFSGGFRAYRVDTLRKLAKEVGPEIIRENSFACMLELLFNLRSVGAKACEVPLVLQYDRKIGASKMKVFSTIRRYFVVMARSFFSRRPAQR